MKLTSMKKVPWLHGIDRDSWLAKDEQELQAQEILNQLRSDQKPANFGDNQVGSWLSFALAQFVEHLQFLLITTNRVAR